MRIFPVLDVKHGQVVRGVGGRREEYRPVVSVLTSSADPVAVARAFRSHFGLDDIYLADLDALGGSSPSLSLYQTLLQDGFHLWVDAGLRCLKDALSLDQIGVQGLVAGLETLAGPETLRELTRIFGKKIIFSLDLKAGICLGNKDAWETDDPLKIASRAVELGVQRLLILDLAQVGMGGGIGTEDLVEKISACHPDLELAAGGGVRGPEDLHRLKKSGVHIVLAASALHDGRLTKKDLPEWIADSERLW